MGKVFALMLLIFSVSAKAQTVMPGNYLNSIQLQSFAKNSLLNDSIPDKKWFVSKTIGISSSFAFFKGGCAAVRSVPFGIQLNRKLSNNWYAFAGAAIAPAYVNFNQSFLSANTNKFASTNNYLQSNRLNIYSRAEMGLMYINDQKTFSISGSISIERSDYPLMPVNPVNAPRPNAFIAPRN
jgi:hypothetical protein